MSAHSLRIDWPPVEAAGNYSVDRRSSVRRKITGRATALVRQANEKDALGRICSLELRDISDTGLGAVAQTPIEVGSTLTVFIAAHGNEQGFDLVGEVVRCTACDAGHHIGVRLTSRAAA